MESRDALLELCGLARKADEPKTSPKPLFGSELHFDDKTGPRT